MSLPQEILALVFSHLERINLWHCQLASKEWYNVSLRPLYSNVFGLSEEKTIAYVRTIIYSPQLGEYLNTIHFGNLFYQKVFSSEFDNTGLLDIIIKYCPNITKMNGFVDDDRFWSRLMDAATQNQLSCLETLPRSFTPNLKSYIDTTLAFKNTLTSLWVNCDPLYSQNQLVNSATNRIIYNQINQFKNLDTLYLESSGFNCVSYFDKLIDKFHSLKTLVLELTHGLDQMALFIEPGLTILPRPDIQTLECFWRQINEERQLEYIMRKFSNLQSLIVLPFPDGFCYSRLALGKFIQYALSVPYFELCMEIDDEEILDIWAVFAKTKNGCKNVTLDYIDEDSCASYDAHQIELSTTSGLCLKFLCRDVQHLPHIQFLSEVGKSFRSVRIGDASFFQHIINETSANIAWLFDILQLCPLLEELTIGNPAPSSPIHHTLQYPSLKKLTISELENIQSIDFLNCLSLSLPSLCQLSLNFSDENMDPIIINMPHTFFDLLIWNRKSYNIIRLFKGLEVYIKLNTDKGLKYYLGKRNMLVPISESRYLLSPKNVQFDIRCKHLKELRIRGALPESDFSFVF